MSTSNYYKKNFKFSANRYEEWQGGRCISQGAISTEIIAEVNDDEIHFELDDIGNLRMLKSFSFEINGEGYCVLPDRIQYIHSTSDFNPIVPIVCNIFFKCSTIDYVRFAMTNPDRIIEFYGVAEEVGQPALGKHTSNEGTSTVSAESILRQLRGYGMLNADAVMERAVNLYNANSNVTNLSQAKAIIESLKLFVRVSQLDNEDNEDQSSMLRPKILMFIALCNYKIDNINRAYCIAKQGLDAVDKATRNSVFSGIPRSMYGADTLEELIGVIENNRFDEVEDDGNYYDIDPEEIDTSKFEEILSRAGVRDAKPSKSQIKQLIETISHIQSQFSKVGERTGDSLRAFEINQTLETFKIPLCLAWQGYKYGWHTDFSKEGDSLFPFMMFEMDLKKNTKQLIDILRRQSPFATIERNSAITNALIAVYTTFIKDIDNGSIKL